jgi:guanyl-specific ribonuclease Sa
MRASMNRGIKLGGMLTAILFAWLQVGCSPSQVGEAPPASQGISGDEPLAAHKSGATAHHDLPAAVPAKVATVLHHIDTNHKAPAGYEGGRKFHNEEKRLPQKDKEGNAITYQEWDVNPKVQGVNRGAERLITGSDGSAYYTSDHYRTFTKIR